MHISPITIHFLSAIKGNVQLNIVACMTLETYYLKLSNPLFKFQDYQNTITLDTLYSSKSIANILTVVKKIHKYRGSELRSIPFNEMGVLAFASKLSSEMANTNFRLSIDDIGKFVEGKESTITESKIRNRQQMIQRRIEHTLKSFKQKSD